MSRNSNEYPFNGTKDETFPYRLKLVFIICQANCEHHDQSQQFSSLKNRTKANLGGAPNKKKVLESGPVDCEAEYSPQELYKCSKNDSNSIKYTCPNKSNTNY